MQATINQMSIADRITAPTPPFFKKLQKIGLIIGAISATILTAGAGLLAVAVTIAGYLATASAVVVSVSQLPVDSNAIVEDGKTL